MGPSCSGKGVSLPPQSALPPGTHQPRPPPPPLHTSLAPAALLVRPRAVYPTSLHWCGHGKATAPTASQLGKGCRACWAAMLPEPTGPNLPSCPLTRNCCTLRQAGPGVLKQGQRES